MHISVYMAQNDLTDEAFAELVGVDRVTVSRWRRQLIRPAAATIIEIRKRTGGKVAGDDWDQTDPQPGRQKILKRQNPARRNRRRKPGVVPETSSQPA